MPDPHSLYFLNIFSVISDVFHRSLQPGFYFADATSERLSQLTPGAVSERVTPKNEKYHLIKIFLKFNKVFKKSSIYTHFNFVGRVHSFYSSEVLDYCLISVLI